MQPHPMLAWKARGGASVGVLCLLWAMPTSLQLRAEAEAEGTLSWANGRIHSVILGPNETVCSETARAWPCKLLSKHRRMEGLRLEHRLKFKFLTFGGLTLFHLVFNKYKRMV